MAIGVTESQDKTIDLAEPKVMGILNVTPDSFYSGSRKQTESEIAGRADEIVREGGCIIDIGAFSTRPGAACVSEEEEILRLRTGLGIVRREQPDTVVSVDTFRPSVARMSVEEFGADMINDVAEGRGFYGNESGEEKCASAGRDSSEESPFSDGTCPSPMFEEIARLGVPYVLMSLQPDMESTVRVFNRKISLLRSLGVKDIILDPGYGFGKDVIGGNFRLLAGQQGLRDRFDLPLLVGVSRKRMIWQTLSSSADKALNGTTVLNTLALERGADILRVHDVRAAHEAVTIWTEFCRACHIQ